MNQLKKIIIVLFLIVGNLLFAQEKVTKKINLNWVKNIDFKITNTEKIRTSIVKDNFVDENLNPTFTKSWEINGNVKVNKFSVKNIIFETLPTSDYKLFNTGKIPTKVTVKFNVVKARDKTLAVLYVMPLLKESNRIKKIISFDLEYSLQNFKYKNAKNFTVKNSVLATGNWYKFAVDTTGVYKIDKKFLQSLGVDVNTINPKNIQIYGNGGAMLPFKNSEFRYDGLQENTIYVSGEEDGSFNENDYILFYAKGPHQWIDTSTSTRNLNQMSHQFNIFSDESYYFITIADVEGKRISNQSPITAPANQQITTFHDYTFYEKDNVNLFATGQQWFGESFNIENIQSFSIPFNDIDSSEDVIVKVRGVTESSLASSMSVKANNQSLFTIDFSPSIGLTEARANENKGAMQLSGNNVTVEISYNNNGNPSAKAYLDYIEILGKKKLIANGNQFSFRNFDVINSAGVFEYSITNSSNISQVWNVTNPINPINILNESTSNFVFKINGGAVHEFIVLNENDYYSPQKIENSTVANQNLHSLNNIDYVIITQEFLKNQAQRIADYHNQNSNLNTVVISLNQIYNEFSSGSPDITAIRDFIKHLYDNATTNKIKYVCLFGDASYDYKDRIQGNNNIVPVFEAFTSFNLATSFVTDDFYGMMDANEGEMGFFEKQDVVTGRIPVSDPLQAKYVVDKILNYYSTQSLGDWRTHLTLVADDIDATGEEVLQVNMEKIANDITTNKPFFNLKKIYIDAYAQQTSSGGNRYPTVNTDITNQVERGTLVIDYFGHGGEDGWAGERILEVPEIQSWKNEVKLPLFITATCEFARFDNPLRKTAGEFLLWNETGGAASLISTTRAIFISIGRAVNEKLIEQLLQFNNENFSIAESLMNTKNQFLTTQRFFIYSLGDPAMFLSIPKPDIKITKMNNVAISQSLDTIKALSYIKFEGEVTNTNGNIVNNFNGELDISVFDKPINKTTLDNDNFNFTMQFKAIESLIFKGRSKVENGKFSFDFVAPKDLKVAYGKGKLSFYATNSTIDKTGSNFDIVIGGINTNAPEDNTGPVVSLYMNDLSFVDGGNTNESPLFIAVLEDESGINTSITAVDHDVVAILDGDQANSIILNDYYQTELNNYKKGKVKYPFRNLTPGLHTITLKVWDTYNNLSETTLTFFVVDDSDLVLSNVLNYPNPFVNYTEFWFNHNKPNELLNVQIQIFTVSGKLVKTINETVQSEGNLLRTITWNGLDDFGSKIGKGVYVYKLKVKSLNSNATAEKIEKLVILQ